MIKRRVLLFILLLIMALATLLAAVKYAYYECHGPIWLKTHCRYMSVLLMYYAENNEGRMPLGLDELNKRGYIKKIGEGKFVSSAFDISEDVYGLSGLGEWPIEPYDYRITYSLTPDKILIKDNKVFYHDGSPLQIISYIGENRHGVMLGDANKVFDEFSLLIAQAMMRSAGVGGNNPIQAESQPVSQTASQPKTGVDEAPKK